MQKPAFFRDYYLPSDESVLPLMVTVEHRNGNYIVSGLWDGGDWDTIKVCFTEHGANITKAAWSGERNQRDLIPDVSVVELQNAADEVAYRQLLERAAKNIGLIMNPEVNFDDLDRALAGVNEPLRRMVQETSPTYM